MRPTDGVLGEAWRLYKGHWMHLVPLALVAYLVVAAITTLLVEGSGGAVAALVAALVNVVALFWLEAALVVAVDDIRDGSADLTLSGTFGRVAPRVGAAALAGILAGLGLLGGFVLLIVPGLILLTWWIVVIPVVVLEERPATAAFARSRALVRGHGWAVFKLILLTMLLLFGAGLLVGLALSPLDGTLRRFLGDVVGGSLAAPFTALVWTLLYFRLRDAQVPGPVVAGA